MRAFNAQFQREVSDRHFGSAAAAGLFFFWQPLHGRLCGWHDRSSIADLWML